MATESGYANPSLSKLVCYLSLASNEFKANDRMVAKVRLATHGS
jgi:hypothetical protein